MATSSQTTPSIAQDSYHTRSKTGCLTCRVRNKKCDEPGQNESCEECKRFMIECVKTMGPLSLSTEVKNSEYGRACVCEARTAVATRARRKDNDSDRTLIELPHIRRLAGWLTSFNNLQPQEPQHGTPPIAPVPLNPPQAHPSVQAAEGGASYPQHFGQSLESQVVIANQANHAGESNAGSGSSDPYDTYDAQAPNLFAMNQMIEDITNHVLPFYAQILAVRLEPAGTLQTTPAHPSSANPDLYHHYGVQPADVIQRLIRALEAAAHAVGLRVPEGYHNPSALPDAGH